IGFDATDDGFYEDARGEVLARPLLAFGSSFLQQTLVRSRLDVRAQLGPPHIVDQRDKLFEIDRVVEARLGPRVDVPEDARRLAELAEHVHVVLAEFRTAGVPDRRPAATLGNLDALLVGHLEEEQVRDLLNVVPVVNAVVTEGVAEPPEFLNNVVVAHAAMASFRS